MKTVPGQLLKSSVNSFTENIEHAVVYRVCFGRDLFDSPPPADIETEVG